MSRIIEKKKVEEEKQKRQDDDQAAEKLRAGLKRISGEDPKGLNSKV